MALYKISGKLTKTNITRDVQGIINVAPVADVKLAIEQITSLTIQSDNKTINERMYDNTNEIGRFSIDQKIQDFQDQNVFSTRDAGLSAAKFTRSPFETSLNTIDLLRNGLSASGPSPGIFPTKEELNWKSAGIPWDTATPEFSNFLINGQLSSLKTDGETKIVVFGKYHSQLLDYGGCFGQIQGVIHEGTQTSSDNFEKTVPGYISPVSDLVILYPKQGNNIKLSYGNIGGLGKAEDGTPILGSNDEIFTEAVRDVGSYDRAIIDIRLQDAKRSTVYMGPLEAGVSHTGSIIIEIQDRLSENHDFTTVETLSFSCDTDGQLVADVLKYSKSYSFTATAEGGSGEGLIPLNTIFDGQTTSFKFEVDTRNLEEVRFKVYLSGKFAQAGSIGAKQVGLDNSMNIIVSGKFLLADAFVDATQVRRIQSAQFRNTTTPQPRRVADINPVETMSNALSINSSDAMHKIYKQKSKRRKK